VVPEIYRYNYAVTDKGIYFTPDATRDRSASIQFLSFATGTATQIVKVEKPLELGLTVSPTAGLSFIRRSIAPDENLMLVENFR